VVDTGRINEAVPYRRRVVRELGAPVCVNDAADHHGHQLSAKVGPTLLLGTSDDRRDEVGKVIDRVQPATNRQQNS